MMRKIVFSLSLITFFVAAAFAQNPPADTEEVRSLLIRTNFEDGSMDLTPVSSTALDSISIIVNRNTQRRYEVHGHSCADAEARHNTMQLSVQR